MTQRHPRGVVDPSATRRPSDPAHGDVATGWTWVQVAQNRFWLLVPVLVLNLLLVGKLPPPLAPGSPGPDLPGWLSLSESVLRGIVFLVPLLMPLSLRTSGTKPALAVTRAVSRHMSRPG